MLASINTQVTQHRPLCENKAVYFPYALKQAKHNQETLYTISAKHKKIIKQSITNNKLRNKSEWRSMCACLCVCAGVHRTW